MERELPLGRSLVPDRMFSTSGIGVHERELQAHDLMYMDAGLGRVHRVQVSSRVPPGCEPVSREDGLRLLREGQVLFAIQALAETDEPGRRIAAAVGDLDGRVSKTPACSRTTRHGGSSPSWSRSAGHARHPPPPPQQFRAQRQQVRAHPSGAFHLLLRHLRFHHATARKRRVVRLAHHGLRPADHLSAHCVGEDEFFLDSHGQLHEAPSGTQRRNAVPLFANTHVMEFLLRTDRTRDFSTGHRIFGFHPDAGPCLTLVADRRNPPSPRPCSLSTRTSELSDDLIATRIWRVESLSLETGQVRVAPFYRWTSSVRAMPSGSLIGNASVRRHRENSRAPCAINATAVHTRTTTAA